ncbi:MAG: hypothetical protein P8N63_02550, partial [Pseudomonadales bacterium]|nr:hypothetical protein [Pseudomonadales bacterium]
MFKQRSSSSTPVLPLFEKTKSPTLISVFSVFANQPNKQARRSTETNNLSRPTVQQWTHVRRG